MIGRSKVKISLYLSISVVVLAETSDRSPRKILVVIIQETVYGITASQYELIWFWNDNHCYRLLECRVSRGTKRPDKNIYRCAPCSKHVENVMQINDFWEQRADDPTRVERVGGNHRFRILMSHSESHKQMPFIYYIWQVRTMTVKNSKNWRLSDEVKVLVFSSLTRCVAFSSPTQSLTFPSHLLFNLQCLLLSTNLFCLLSLVYSFLCHAALFYHITVALLVHILLFCPLVCCACLIFG